jgi:hypothetical protein
MPHKLLPVPTDQQPAIAVSHWDRSRQRGDSSDYLAACHAALRLLGSRTRGCALLTRPAVVTPPGAAREIVACRSKRLVSGDHTNREFAACDALAVCAMVHVDGDRLRCDFVVHRSARASARRQTARITSACRGCARKKVVEEVHQQPGLKLPIKVGKAAAEKPGTRPGSASPCSSRQPRILDITRAKGDDQLGGSPMNLCLPLEVLWKSATSCLDQALRRLSLVPLACREECSIPAALKLRSDFRLRHQ